MRKKLTRREALARSVSAVFVAGMDLALPLPAWAARQQPERMPSSAASPDRLVIGRSPILVNGRNGSATGINGSVPGPLLRWREGDTVAIDVHNELHEPTSIHWHGLLLPSNMDGVPGLSFAGIDPGDSYRYRFTLRQNGTYWYHSHSGFQEQTGVYGPLIIDPIAKEPFAYDAEFVVLLSDWTFEDPTRVMKRLKIRDDYYNYNRRTVSEFFRDARADGYDATIADRRMWGNMRMKASDVADVSGATYTYLMNGSDTAANWTGIYQPGQRIRLRVINGSAQSFFNVRVPGLPMTVVQADGQNIEPVVVDEFQIGTAETFDVLIEPEDENTYAVYAEAMDRSGFVQGTLATRAGMTAQTPPMRPRPRVTMRDMGMGHGSMGHGMGHDGMHHPGTDHSDHMNMSHAAHDAPSVRTRHDHARGPGVANVTENPINRLDEVGQGLEGTSHRVLRYSQVRSLTPNTDTRPPGRSIEIHLTGNMERYMWSLNGVKYSEVREPIRFTLNERLRMILVNDTMMSHPIHLHGMFFELDNGSGVYNPRKHTVVVKPAERLEILITANEPGHWAFHCHLLYHMKAGMMQSVLVAPAETNT